MSWPVFISTLPFIFVAALPGRTTFVMMMMAARGYPLGIFLGAAAAFFVQSCISIALGSVLAIFPQHWVQMAAGLLFLYFAYRFWKEASDAAVGVDEAESKAASSFRAAVRSSFLLIFIAEWGDVSQVAIASLAAKQPDRATLLCSSVVALWTIAGLAVGLGSYSHRFIHPARLQKLASVAFAGIGIYLLSQALISIL